MLTLFEKAQERLTGYRARSDFRKPMAFQVDERHIGPRPEQALDEYEIKLTLSTTYRAYKFERHREREAAERVLRTELYRDVLVAIDRAMHAVSDGDANATIAILSDLRKDIVG